MKKNFIKIKLTIAVISIIIYFICLYAALTGNIEFLQGVTERRLSRGIFGHIWMLYGIWATAGFYFSIESVFDHFKLFMWRKKHSVLAFIIECVIPMAILIVLDFYRTYDETFVFIIGGTSSFVLLMILIAQWSNIKAFIKKKISTRNNNE